MSKIQCKICNKYVGKNNFKKHLLCYHNNLDIYLYGKNFNLNFYVLLSNKKIYINNFENQCKICNNIFLLTIMDDENILIKRCLGSNCSNKSFKNKLSQFFNKETKEFKDIFLNYQSSKISGCSLKNMIKKYGEELGLEKWNNWKNSCKATKENFIKRHGVELGLIKWNIFKENFINSKEKFIEKYGELEGLIKWNKYISNKKRTSIRSLEYWLIQTNNIELAKELHKKSQLRDLNYFIEKYGETLGNEKYNNRCKKVSYSLTLDGFINRYGEEKGTELYNIKGKKSSYANSLNYFIEKYGETLGNEKYNKFVISKFSSPTSKIEINFIESLIKLINKSYTYYYDKKSWFVSVAKNKFYYVDLYIKELNIVIEFYGDYWHANPKIFKPDTKILNTTALEIWNKNTQRINDIKQKINCKIIIIWEKDYREDKEKTLNNCLLKIKEVEKWRKLILQG